MKVCVYGAGAIGSLIAGRLACVSGIEVSVVARGEQLDAISRQGIRIVDAAGEVTAHVKATDNPASLGVQDYVFLALKQHQLLDVVNSIEPLIGTHTSLIPPTTGIPYWYFYGQPGAHANRRIDRLDPGGTLWRAIPPQRVLGCVFRVAAQVVAPGVVHQDGSYAKLPLGEPDGSVSARVRRLSEAMCAAGFESPVVDNIRSWLWIKMISSLCWNPVAALTLATWGELAASPGAVDVVRRMMQEADAVACALGGPPPIAVEERLAAARSAPHHKMSMLQDLERGRPLEYQPLADSIEAMRDIAGLGTPTIDSVLALLRLRANRG
ncbi:MULTISPECIES: 2-dehydropantoate 2-reductase [Paraburkholderia]|uniref:ketopantoate reductase family protein n=1 Tax=Paraburkholderia TaxID=1822464 RepID=UPI0003448F3D|nr:MULTISPECIES: 2-dehydropantoate 2-reductase [Paraburkholderia]WEY39846.1 2-dehydropantoate 2-reductase [Paraburkholderia sp. SUR17]